jgi:hypothetical protein
MIACTAIDDGILDINHKAHLMEDWKLPLAYDHGVNPRDYVVHVYGSTAVLNYLVTIHEQFTNADIISEQRATETYVKQNGSWLLIARQWGHLPLNFHKPVAVDTGIYKRLCWPIRVASAGSSGDRVGEGWETVDRLRRKYGRRVLSARV